MAENKYSVDSAGRIGGDLGGAKKKKNERPLKLVK
jgi:hypothetical protein